MVGQKNGMAKRWSGSSECGIWGLVQDFKDLFPGAIGSTSMLLGDRNGALGDHRPRGLIFDHSDDPRFERFGVGEFGGCTCLLENLDDVGEVSSVGSIACRYPIGTRLDHVLPAPGAKAASDAP